MSSVRGSTWLCLGVVCALGATAARGADEHYYYFKGRRELKLDTSRIAIRTQTDQVASDPSPTLRRVGIEAEDLHAGPVPGWSFADVPVQRRAAADIAQLTSSVANAGAGFVSPVFIGEDGGPIIVLPEILLQFDASVEPARRRAILADAGLTVVKEDWAKLPRAFRLGSAARNGFDVLRSANDLAQRPEVLFAEPNVLFTGRGGLVPNDPLFVDQWEHDNTGQAGGTPDMDMDSPEAWDITTGDASIIVVVLDTGVQQDHPDLNQVAGIDLTTDAGDGGPMNSCDNHATAVAGCISAIVDNGIGTAGVAPGCKVASARAMISNLACNGTWSSETTWTVDALAWAESIGARVTNNSNVYGFTSSAIAAKYASTRNAGMVHFASAGNSGIQQISYPASLPSVMAIGAINRFGNKPTFSNYGNGLAYTAPGDDVVTTDRSGNAGYGPGDYVVIDGTSFASPYAAGVAALALSLYPALSAADVEALMRVTSTDLGAPGKDVTFGSGLVNALNAVLFDFCPPEMPGGDPTGVEKNRYISLVPGHGWGPYALRVELTELMRPSPPNHPCCPAPDFSEFEGQYRWVGPLQTCPDSASQGTTFYCAVLQCEPHYFDWGSAAPGAVIHVTGREIMPSSLYRVQAVSSECPLDESPALQIRTARWGDVAPPYQDRAAPSAVQPNATDIATIVDKVKDTSGAVTKVRTQLQPGAINPQAQVSALDIGYTISAVKRVHYSLGGPAACP